MHLDPGCLCTPGANDRSLNIYEQFAIPVESFAQAVAFAMSQPEEVDVNEIPFRPTRRDP